MEEIFTKKVVIIDDEVDWCMLMKSYLDRRQFQVSYFNSLSEAFPQIFDLKPDIVFLDNNLPDGAGWEKAVELLDKIPGLQLHLISAYNTYSTLVSQAQPRSIHIWEKPLSIKELDAYFTA